MTKNFAKVQSHFGKLWQSGIQKVFDKKTDLHFALLPSEMVDSS
ncbi:hypothetical protein [Halpernia sp.]